MQLLDFNNSVYGMNLHLTYLKTLHFFEKCETQKHK